MTRLFALMLAGYAAGLVGAVTAPGAAAIRRLSAAGAAIGAAAAAALGLSILATGGSFALSVPWILPVADGIAFHLDPLGGFFLLLLGIVAVPSAFYGAAYARSYEGRYSLRFLGAMLNLFLLTMSLVPCAANILTLLLCWEGMSLTSYFLVLTESDDRDTVRAGHWYIAMTHIGLVFIIAALLLLASPAGVTDFATLREAARVMSPSARSAVFLLAAVGFSSKAGIVPLHVWLPRAHPAAPSHVSALMSGVMIAMGVYGVIRVGLDLLGGGPIWWGALLIGVGTLSAVTGVLYALMANDVKRLLAYSSIENMGLVYIGIGAGFLFLSLGLIPAAALAFSAGLYHALNHGAFKGLLFLGAGSVLHATHTRDMNRLGGLIRNLPWTALFFLIGAMAAAGLPPLNGFVSEWLLFQSLLPGIGSHVKLVAPLSTLAVGMLALTGGLAATGLVKAFGITFLAMPRSSSAAQAREASPTMRIAMGGLAAASVGLGLSAVAVLSALRTVLGVHPVFRYGAALNVSGRLGLSTTDGFAEMSPALIATALVLAVVGLLVGLRVLMPRRIRVSETWGCGRLIQTPRMEYTATAFAEPLRRVFAELYRPTQDLSIDFHPESKYFVQSIEYQSAIVPWFERYLYSPAIAALTRAAARVRRLQSGSAHAYLTYLVISLVALLSWWLAQGS
jgi:formate hydrogenlyase subunit 3/multisubunit Na+/H+ antiporter MnhD subunit